MFTESDERGNRAIVTCDCHAHYLLFSLIKNNPPWGLEVCPLDRAACDRKMDWREVLRHVWRLVTKRRDFTDWFIIPLEELRPLGEWLLGRDRELVQRGTDMTGGTEENNHAERNPDSAL